MVAQRLQAEEAKNEAERKRKRDAEEKRDFELAQKLMSELEDEKFAADLERHFKNEERKRKEALEKDMKAAKRLQDEEESVYRKLLEEERKKKEHAGGPGYWVLPLLKDEKFRRVPIDEDNALWDLVEGKFRECKRKIKSIEFIQNEKVWKQFIEAKRQTGLPEVWRFHGTPFDNVEAICEKGLLTSNDVSGGGTTIWSAENPSYSVGYSNKGPAPDGTLYMFLCRVLSTTATISTVQTGAHIFPEFIIAYGGEGVVNTVNWGRRHHHRKR